MTPAEIRATFNETISAYRRSTGETAKANARLLLAALHTHPFLVDQIPWDVFDMAVRDAK